VTKGAPNPKPKPVERSKKVDGNKKLLKRLDRIIYLLENPKSPSKYPPGAGPW
jgi:hypothetical protein